MEYTQLKPEQLQELRRGQLLQYESDFARAQVVIDVAQAIIASGDAGEDAKAQAQLQLSSAREQQGQLDVAHAEVLGTFTAAAAELAKADVQAEPPTVKPPTL